MKTDALGFGFEVLITFLLPGLLVALAAGITHGVTPEQAEELLEAAVDAEFLASFSILAITALLGAATASLQAVIETVILDPITARLVKLDRKKFDQQWDRFVADLPAKNNPYVGRVVLFFQFETRMGLALLLLGAALTRLSWAHAAWFGLAGLAFYAVGLMHHRELAIMRKQAYP